MKPNFTTPPLSFILPRAWFLACLLCATAPDTHGQTTTPPNQPPVIQWVQPGNQSVFPGPTNVLLVAEASDPDGVLRRVEFFKGSALLGSVPGQENGHVYNFTWTNAQPGTYTLTARAVDFYEARATSAPVTIVISGNSTALPSVNVFAIDAEAREGGTSSNLATNTGTFKFTRTGSTNAPLTLQYELGGTAQNGADYQTLPESFTIPAGALHAYLLVVPVDDSLIEGDETVVITLRTNFAYVLGSNRTATVTIKDNDAPPPNQPPTVWIINPTNQAVVPAGTNLLIQAHASDQDGWIHTVEFFHGETSLGTVTNNPLVLAPTVPFSITWSNVPPGTHMLRAKATDNQGAIRLSEPVTMIAQQPPPPVRPVVSIRAIDSEASEGSSSAANVNWAIFEISRAENTNVTLTVHYSVGGTASNGVDYEQLSGSVTIPAGVISAKVFIKPVDDTLVEDDESVVLSIKEPVCATTQPVSSECYLIGTPREAVAVIRDNDPVNQPPSVHIQSPANNAVFYGPLQLPIEATATDADGHVTRVDFFAGTLLLGGDTTPPFGIIWSNAPPGTHSLTARATDNNGAVRHSEPVKVTIRSANEIAFVRRQLPLWYVPGVKLVVHLRAEPKTNVLSCAVEDLPPSGWTVGAVSTGGSFNPADGKVKFGPFADNLPRTLTYEVTPPTGEQGEKRFAGIAVADGQPSPVVGASVVVSAPPHPADRSPADFSMTLEELNHYASAWKLCEKWTVSPNPIPVNYLTRAGYLHASGEMYRISTSFPTPVPPLLWVSSANSEATLAGTASSETPWVTNSVGSAVSVMPTNYAVGVTFAVTIHVTPSAGVRAYAVEERPPKGWQVSSISHGGVFCPVTGKIRWGLFLDNAPRALNYVVAAVATNAPSQAQFSGVASFNGINVPVTGQRIVRRTSSTSTDPKLEPVKLLSTGDRMLTFTGDPGVCYVIEGTSDFVSWTPIEVLLNNDGALQYIDLSTNDVFRFYRAVPKPQEP